MIVCQQPYTLKTKFSNNQSAEDTRFVGFTKPCILRTPGIDIKVFLVTPSSSLCVFVRVRMCESYIYIFQIMQPLLFMQKTNGVTDVILAGQKQNT